MKNLLTLCLTAFCMIALYSHSVIAQTIKSDTVTIKDIQFVNPDTLAAGFASGDATKKEKCQYSSRLGDTVTVTGIVIAAPRVSPAGQLLFALGNANTLYIVDENGGAWSGLNVRATDSAASVNTLITAVDTGFVVRFTGVVTQYYATTQFEIGKIAAWEPKIPVEILDTKPRRPLPTEITLADLVKGDPKSLIAASAQWEGAYVIIKDLSVGTLSKNTGTGRYTWTIADKNGNSIGVYDQSIYFRGGAQGFDPNWAPPAIGTKITSMRGIITSSGQGIVIAPIYPGDMVLGSFPPIVSNIQRDIPIPTSTQSVVISAHVEDSNPDGSIAEVKLVYGTGAAPIATLDMTYDAGTKTATVTVPAQSDGSVVWYYFTAKDNSSESVQYPGDITKSRPFYIVRDGSIRIRDIQYTPYADGSPGCIGDTVITRGVVMASADTTNLGLIFIQDGITPWSGMMIRGDAAVRALQLGDDVTITGKVAEGYSSSSTNNTMLNEATVTTNHGKAALYSAIVLPTGTFKSGVVTDGAPAAEQWEGMLLKFNNLTITASNADAPAGSFFGEFLVNDGSGDMRADDFGSWKKVYTNDTTKTSLIFLTKGKHLDALSGIMYFNFGNYKLQPRNAADFEGLTDVEYIASAPASMSLHQNYPNPASSVSTITVDIAKTSVLTLQVFDALGRKVSTLMEGSYIPGTYRNHMTVGSLPAGLYMYKLTVDGSVQSKTMVVVK